MEQLLWPDMEPGAICVFISAEFPRNPCEVGTIIFSILQLWKLRLGEVMILLKQAATGPYSAFVWAVKRHPSPSGQSTWEGTGLGKQIAGWVPASTAPLWVALCRAKPVQSHAVAVGMRPELVNSRTGLKNHNCLTPETLALHL